MSSGYVGYLTDCCARFRIWANVIIGAEGCKETEFVPLVPLGLERSLLTTKTVPKKEGGGSVEKRDIGIFDDSMEANLTLWGSSISSADCWEISNTILLISKPSLKLWKKDVQVSLGHATVVEIDPIHKDAQWLRTYAKKLLRKPDLCQPFPHLDFEWEEALYGEHRIKFTFADIDTYSRDIDSYTDFLPTGKCVGWLNAMIVEMNVVSLYDSF